MEKKKLQNKAVIKAPKDKTIEVVKDYAGISKGTKYKLKSFDQSTINMMVEKGLWKCK
jgi:hypothetical protein